MNNKNFLPRLIGTNKNFDMSRDHFLAKPPKILCVPGPGQTPGDVSSLGPCRDWPKKGQLLRVPQVVFISIMPDPTVYSEQMDVRQDYANSVWNYPTPIIPGVQTNMQALPWANFGIGRSFSYGIGNVGWHGIQPPLGQRYFPEVFDVAYNGKEWPKQTVPIRYEVGKVSNPEPAYYQKMVAVANEVKRVIEKTRKGKTFVSVLPYCPQTLSWQDSDFQEGFPHLKLNPHANWNVISPLLEGIVPGAGTLAFGGWNDVFTEVLVITKINKPTPPQEIWYKHLPLDKYKLPWVDWSDPANQIPWDYTGPGELMVAQPFPKNRAFFGPNFLHIYIGYRSWMHGPQLTDNLWLGNLTVADVEALWAGHSLTDVAAASANGFETSLLKSQFSTADYLRTMQFSNKYYRNHRTMVFGFPSNLGWSNSIKYQDPREFEQFKYFFGGVLHGGLNPNIYQPSFFNGYDPDVFIEGGFDLIQEITGIHVPFDYPIEIRWPFNSQIYNGVSGKFGPYTFLQFLKAATEKMQMYWGPMRTAMGDAHWRAQFDQINGAKNNVDNGMTYGQNGVTYEGTAEGLDVNSMIGIISKFFKF